MSPDLYAKCPKCGYFLSLYPIESDGYPCDNLNIYSDTGRFSIKTGDSTIKIYRRKSY